MAVIGSVHEAEYSLYNGDSCEVLPDLPANSVHLSIYSPPFGGLYHYSSSERDLSNARTYDEFFAHYEYIVAELARVTMPGRMSCVHCMDVPKEGANFGGSIDFPGDIIRLHERHGFEYTPRRVIHKEPLAVRNRTMAKGLAHKTIVEDANNSTAAAADYLISFRKRGVNPIPVAHPTGLDRYCGTTEIPHELFRYRNWKGKQTENKFSHWIWRRYASTNWDDIDIGRILPYEESREPDDEKHVHPLQLDVIERCVHLHSNPGEVVLTPFMGVGSEVYGAVINGRKGIGVELKPSYYRQSVANVAAGVKSFAAARPVAATLPGFADGAEIEEEVPA